MQLGTAEITALVGLCAAIIGTIGGKFFDNYMQKRKMKIDYGSQIRSEQRAEIMNLRSELDDTEEKVDEWRDRYFELKEENVKQQSMMDDLQTQIDLLKKLQ